MQGTELAVSSASGAREVLGLRRSLWGVGVIGSFLEEADGSRMINRGFQDLSGARGEVGKVTALGQNVAQTRTLGCIPVLMYFICII